MASKALNYSDLGQRLQQFAVTIGYENVLTDYGSIIDMTPANFQRYLKGEREPGFGVLERIANTGCSLDYLMGNSENMFSSNTAGIVLQAGIEAQSFLDIIRKISSFGDLDFLPQATLQLISTQIKGVNLTPLADVIADFLGLFSEGLTIEEAREFLFKTDGDKALFESRANKAFKAEELLGEMLERYSTALLEPSQQLRLLWIPEFLNNTARRGRGAEFWEFRNSPVGKLLLHLPSTTLLTEALRRLSNEFDAVRTIYNAFLGTLKNQEMNLTHTERLEQTQLFFRMTDRAFPIILHTMEIWTELCPILAQTQEFGLMAQHSEAMEKIITQFPLGVNYVEEQEMFSLADNLSLTPEEIRILKQLAANQAKREVR